MHGSEAQSAAIIRPFPVGQRRNETIQYTSLRLLREGPAATIILDRRDADNRLDLRLAEELRSVLDCLAADDDLRLVVLTAAGPVFSTGRDDAPTGASQAATAAWIQQMRIASALAELPVPVIVALNGDATDHGLELALAGDLRLAVADAKFGFSRLAPGTFPWDGGTQRLPRLVGPAWARDLLLTGRSLDAAEALAIGLVNGVADSQDHLRTMTQALAESVCAGSPVAARYAKEAINKGMDLTLDQGLRLEADLNIILQSTDDRAEGISSFLERRPPEFRGR